MAQVVQTDRRETGGGDEPLEAVGHFARVQPGAVLLREDMAGLDPGRVALFGVRVPPIAVPHLLAVLRELGGLPPDRPFRPDWRLRGWSR